MLAELDTLAQRAWLIGLLLVWAALLFGGLLWRSMQPSRKSRMPVQTRLLSSLTLVVAGWSWRLFSRGSEAADYAWLIAGGMTLGFIGDLFMARVLPFGPNILVGMAAFGLGHLAYIAAGLRIAAAEGLTVTDASFAVWALWLLIGAIGWYMAVMRGTQRTSLHWMALPYALLLSSTAGVATGLAFQARAFLPFAAGAVLFLISDLILAAELFGERRFPGSADLIWLTYGPGQMLIVYSVGTVMTLTGA